MAPRAAHEPCARQSIPMVGGFSQVNFGKSDRREIDAQRRMPFCEGFRRREIDFLYIGRAKTKSAGLTLSGWYLSMNAWTGLSRSEGGFWDFPEPPFKFSWEYLPSAHSSTLVDVGLDNFISLIWLFWLEDLPRGGICAEVGHLQSSYVVGFAAERQRAFQSAKLFNGMETRAFGNDAHKRPREFVVLDFSPCLGGYG